MLSCLKLNGADCESEKLESVSVSYELRGPSQLKAGSDAVQMKA